jgi:hypothetical protein
MIRADGRWLGRLTQRPLLDGDATVECLDDASRSLISAVWLARSATERRVADSFALIREALTELRADSTITKLAERAIDDEFRHAEICRLVASRFAGRELEAPALLELAVPKHHGATQRTRGVLWVLGQCCMNETIASGFLEAALRCAGGPMARGALRELLSDEIDHARMGWMLLASLPPAVRTDVEPWLLQMLRLNLKMWRDSPRDYPGNAELAAQGAPTEIVVEQALLGSIGELIIPGFEEAGFSMTEARAWLAAGAPTD